MLARSLVALALIPGCATGWIATEAAGGQRVLDEDVHEVHVPQPGVTEHLNVTLQEPAPAMGSAAATTASVTCGIDQSATDLVYHQAFRYGSRWKKAAAIAFVLEAAASAAFLLTASDKEPNGYVYGGYLGLDALVTAPLIFIPRKEIYRTDEVPVTTAVRDDCPDGLAIAIGSDSFPVDASGRIGDLGAAALAEWMKTPGAPLRIDIAGQERELACTGPTCTGTIPFAAGTLTSVAAATPGP